MQRLHIALAPLGRYEPHSFYSFGQVRDVLMSPACLSVLPYRPVVFVDEAQVGLGLYANKSFF